MTALFHLFSASCKWCRRKQAQHSLLLDLVVPSSGQLIGATIEGTVTDATEFVIPNAVAFLTNGRRFTQYRNWAVERQKES